MSFLYNVSLFESETSIVAAHNQNERLKLLELLLGACSLSHFEDIEPHSLAEWSALTNGHDVSNGDVSAGKNNSDGLTGVWRETVHCNDNGDSAELHQHLPKALSSELLELGRPS